MMDWRQARWPQPVPKMGKRRVRGTVKFPHLLNDEGMAVDRLRYSESMKEWLL